MTFLAKSVDCNTNEKFVSISFFVLFSTTNLGWAYDLKTVSEEIIKNRAARTGDGTNDYSKCIEIVKDSKPVDNFNCFKNSHNNNSNISNNNNSITVDNKNNISNDNNKNNQLNDHHHHHHLDEHTIWGWDDIDMDKQEKKDALIINKGE